MYIFFFYYNVQIFLEKKKKFPKIWKKKFQSAILNPLGRSTGNNFLLKGGPMCHDVVCVHRCKTSRKSNAKYTKYIQNKSKIAIIMI